MGCLVDGLQVVHGTGHGAVLHLAAGDGAVPVDGVGIELDPQVGGPHGRQLRGGDGHRGFWKDKRDSLGLENNSTLGTTIYCRKVCSSIPSTRFP